MSLAPHGGKLVDRLAADKEREELLARAERIPKVHLNPREASDLELIAVGAYSPLEGFMNRADYINVLNCKRLANGTVWTLPVTFSLNKESLDALGSPDDVALCDPSGEILGHLQVEEIYQVDPWREAYQVYQTTDLQHPGVRWVVEGGTVRVGGKVVLLNGHRPRFPEHDRSPADTRSLFRERSWRKVVAFQTRNPIHRAHEYIQKCALEMVDGLFIHPLVGHTSAEDIPAEVRMRCYMELLEHYYPRDRVLLAVFPAAMRYAGPREAVFHALVRKNYGCTHFIVGRDHAGVGNFYGPYDAQRIFDEFEGEEIGIRPIFFESTFYCGACGHMASPKTCRHPESDRVLLSGTQVRQMLQRGQPLPLEFTRPEVARILQEAFHVEPAPGRKVMA